MARAEVKRITFGHGQNSAVRARDVKPSECFTGENFALDLDFTAMRNRKAFDLAGTATNAGQINGFAQLVKTDGTISTLVQAGTNVYSWDGSSTFTLVGTVASGTKMRGPLTANWTLDDKVIISDLARIENLSEWDGTTFQDVSHSLTGSLQAKYAFVENEVLFLANVISNGVDTPHVLLSSKRGVYTTLDVDIRPQVAAEVDSAWFLPIPDFRPINGLFSTLGVVVLSTERGRLYRLTGTDAFSYALEQFHEGSAVSGDEALASIGNDVILGRAGHLDLLSGVQRFGDTAVDDVSAWIFPDIKDETSWIIAYDRTSQKVFCWPGSGSKVWVLNKNILTAEGLSARIAGTRDRGSPWAKWTTAHTTSFTPTAVMAMRRPSDGIDVVYFGDASGNIYQLEGSGADDGGTDPITAFRETGIIDSSRDPISNNVLEYDGSGYVDHRRLSSADVTLTFQHQGVDVFKQAVDITIPPSTEFGTYGTGTATNNYYDTSGAVGDDNIFYGDQFLSRLSRQTFRAAGHSSFFSLRTSFSGSADVEIDEIGLNYKSS